MMDRRAVRCPGAPIDRAPCDHRPILAAIASDCRELVDVETLDRTEPAGETEFDEGAIVSVPLFLLTRQGSRERIPRDEMRQEPLDRFDSPRVRQRAAERLDRNLPAKKVGVVDDRAL